MRHRVFFFMAVVTLVVSCWSGGFSWAQDATDYERIVTQSEFATGVVGAILGQVRSSIDDGEALKVLKDRGLAPAAWTGDGLVTMGEAAATFHQLGFQVYIEDSEDFLTSGVFEQILRHHLGEIKKTKHHWDIVHHFSMGLTLGEYRERILPIEEEPPISASGF